MAVGSIPRLPDRDGMDVVTTMGDEDALDMARRLAKVEGILAGISAGAATHAALEVDGRPESRGQLLVAILPDSGERYLSTALFDSENARPRDSITPGGRPGHTPTPL